jgi:tRNA(Ile)-lysidine synthase
VIATAHTRDDQLETVIMRLMRGAGARGLAALLAESPDITRPLVRTPRAALTNYAKLHALRWVDDPTNQSRRFFRNRVRLDLLPALRTADPTLPASLIGLAEQAAALRLDMERLARPWVRRDGDALVVAENVLALPSQQTRAAFWPALLGPQQVVLDRRGIDRLSTLEVATPYGSRVPLAGGWEGTRVEGGVRIRQTTGGSSAPLGPLETLPARGRVRFGRWTFEVLPEAPPGMPDDAWSVWLPHDAPASVRSWEDGDRIAAGQQGTLRRVKRFFSDRRIAANDRKGWPVVIANGEIIWIPGIRRATAVAVRSGRPVRLVVCERIHV